MSPERALLQMLIDKNSLEFLQEKPKEIDATILITLAQTYCSRPILARLQQLI
jgi:hypothetical protein